MRLPLILAAVGGATLLAACQPMPPSTTVVVTPPASECIADRFQQFVGQKSPAITVPAGTEVRHYRTGDLVTMDLNPSRLNFEYDRTGKLVKVSCG